MFIYGASYSQDRIFPNDSLEIERLIDSCSFYLKRDVNKVDRFILKAQDFISVSNHKKRLQEARVLSLNGILNRNRGNYLLALEDYFRATEILEDLNSDRYLANIYNNISIVFRRQEENVKALQYCKKAIELNKMLNRERALAGNYRIMAKGLHDLKRPDSVMYYLGLAEKLYKKNDDEYGYFKISSTKAKILRENQQFDKSLELNTGSINYFIKNNYISNLISVRLNMAQTYLAKNELGEALFNVNEGIRLSKNQRNAALADAFKIRSAIYSRLNKTNDAFDDYKRHVELHNEVFDKDKSKAIRNLELTYKFKNQQLVSQLKFEEEKKLLELENQKNITQKKLYIALSIIGLIISIMLLRFFRNKWIKAKKEEEVLKQRLSVSSMKNTYRINRLNKDIDQLNNQIESKREEVATLMTESLKHLKSKEKLVVDLKKVAANEMSLKSIIADLNSEALDDTRLTLIKNHLEELNFEFFHKLKSMHAELTDVDLEICSYIKLGFGRREIAKLRNTSIDAVKKSRYRIRKKMNLDKEVDLLDYINKI